MSYYNNLIQIGTFSMCAGSANIDVSCELGLVVASSYLDFPAACIFLELFSLTARPHIS